MENFDFNGTKLELEIDKNVWYPSPFTYFFARNIKVNPKETVIDIGTGSGALAILAAKKGASVFATDIFSEAIVCAKKNAKSNNVLVSFSRGEFFAGFKQKFDVVIANLPQEIMPKSYREKIGKHLAAGSDGGKDGNTVALELLKTAKKHMGEKSRLYISVGTMCDYEPLISAVVLGYNARILEFVRMPIKEFELENLWAV